MWANIVVLVFTGFWLAFGAVLGVTAACVFLVVASGVCAMVGSAVWEFVLTRRNRFSLWLRERTNEKRAAERLALWRRAEAMHRDEGESWGS